MKFPDPEEPPPRVGKQRQSFLGVDQVNILSDKVKSHGSGNIVIKHGKVNAKGNFCLSLGLM